MLPSDENGDTGNQHHQSQDVKTWGQFPSRLAQLVSY